MSDAVAMAFAGWGLCILIALIYLLKRMEITDTDRLAQVHLELQGAGKHVNVDDPLWSLAWQLAKATRIRAEESEKRYRSAIQTVASNGYPIERISRTSSMQWAPYRVQCNTERLDWVNFDYRPKQ